MRRTSGLIASKISLNVLQRMTKCIPIFGDQVAELVNVASDIVGTVEKHRLNQAANDELARKVVRTLEITALALREPEVVRDRIPKLKADLEEIETIVLEIKHQLERHYALHRYERVIMTITSEDAEMTKGFCDKLDDALQRFNFKAQIHMRLGLQQVQDMLELGMLGIGDIRNALAADQQIRRRLETERTGPCCCAGDGRARPLYECKHCLLEAINGDDDVSEERYFGAASSDEPASYAAQPGCVHRAPSQRPNTSTTRSPQSRPQHAQLSQHSNRSNTPPKYHTNTTLHISTHLKPPPAAPAMYNSKTGTTAGSMRSPPSTTFSATSTSDESVPETPTDIPFIYHRDDPAPVGHKIAFPMPTVPLYRY